MEAVVERFAEEQVLSPISEIRDRLPALIHLVGERAVDAVADEGVGRGTIDLRFVRAEMRFSGQEATLSIPADRPDLLVRRFRRQHRARFGYCPAGRAVELVALRAVASSRRPETEKTESFVRRGTASLSLGGDRSDRVRR